VPRARRNPTASKGVSRDQILEAALHLVETRVEAALSMRNLAAELDVATTTIYWHVGNREALVHLLIEHFLGGVVLDEPVGGDPPARLAAVCRSLRRAMLERPTIFELAARENSLSQVWVLARDACLREIEAAGITGPNAVTALRAVLIHVVGFVHTERSLSMYEPARRRADHAGVAGLPVESDELAELMAAPLDSDALFDYSVGCLIAGLFDGRGPKAPRSALTGHAARARSGRRSSR